MRRLAPFAALALVMMPAIAGAAPGDDDARLIDAAIRAGRLIQARAMLARLPDAAPVAIETLRADLALAEGRNADALRAFEALGQGAPDNCAFLTGAGIAASRTDKPDRAIASLQRATERCAVDWQAWNALGVAFDATGQWEASASAYAHALVLRPSNAALLNNIGLSMIRQHRFALAAGYLQAAVHLAPGDTRIVDNLDVARASIGQPLVRNPDTEDAARWAERLANAGRAAMLAGRPADARALLAQAIATSPTYQASAVSSLTQLNARP